MKKFNFKKVGEIQFKSSKRVDFQISAVDSGFLQPAEIKYLIQQYEKKYPNSKFLVTGLGVAGRHELGDNTKYQTSTLKKFSSGFSFQDEEEYLDGRVRDTTKFLQYFQITISVFKPAPQA
jgi:hypothetical protein